MSTKNFIDKEFNKLIKRGFHLLVIKDAIQTTIQPLTNKGLDALRTMLSDFGVNEDSLSRLAEKRHGHYVAAVPLENDVLQIVLLVERYGMLQQEIGIMNTNQEITPLFLDENIH